jgi:peptidoglycan/xylan/chitin deacetylase (PgdA/CDA1 family)
MSKTFSWKQFIRQLVDLISFYSGYCSFSDLLKFNNGMRILCYHGISEVPTNHYAVSVNEFTMQMDYLVKNNKIVSIDKMVSLFHEINPIQNNTIAVSIDDGYQDFFKYGFPILKKFVIPATVFVPTGFIDDVSKLKKMCRLPQNEYLTWDQIREMGNNGIDFGSHTVSHISLTKLSKREIQFELERSKDRLENELGKSVRGFAYPYGTFRDIDPSIGKLISEIGYSWAVTSISGSNKLGSDNFSLHRTMVERDDGIAGFSRIIKGSLDAWVVMQKCSYYREKGRHYLSQIFN